jgi:FkbM family methyltransferase
MENVASRPWLEYAPSLSQSAWIAAIRHAPPWLRRPLARQRDALTPAWLAPFDISVRGINFRCHFADNTPERKLLFQGRRMDHWHLAQLKPFLRPGATFVDIGANFGFFSLNACKIMGDRGRILSFEPNPLMAARLRDNIRVNNFGSIAVDEAAVGRNTGFAGRDQSVNDHGSVGYGAEPPGTSSSDWAVSSVAIVPLLEGLNRHGVTRVDALKIDIEGHEADALLPFFATAPKTLYPRMILMEESHAGKWDDDVIGHLKTLGYQITARGRMDIVLCL